MKRLLAKVLAVALCAGALQIPISAETVESSGVVDEAVIEAMQSETAIPVVVTHGGLLDMNALKEEAWTLAQDEIALMETEGLTAVKIETEKCKYYLSHYAALKREECEIQNLAFLSQLGIDAERAVLGDGVTVITVTLSPEEIEAAAAREDVSAIEMQVFPESSCVVDPDVQERMDAGDSSIPVVLFYEQPDVTGYRSLYWSLAQEYTQEYIDFTAFTSSEREMIWVNAAEAMYQQELKAAASAGNAELVQTLGLAEGSYWASGLVGTMTAVLTPEQIRTAAALPYMETIGLITPLYGDVDGDGLVTASDASEILVECTHYGTYAEHLLSDTALVAADFNGDGVIDAADASDALVFAAESGVNSTTEPTGG